MWSIPNEVSVKIQHPQIHDRFLMRWVWKYNTPQMQIGGIEPGKGSDTM